jgi:hypothetical protein
MKVPDMGVLGFLVLLMLGCLAGAGVAYLVSIVLLCM